LTAPARWHFIEGAEGCRFAREHRCAAVIVDALRASATASALLEAGADNLLVVDTVEQARALKAGHPEYLLAGERGGLPPEGFDLGNSPGDIAGVAGRTVVFTTSNGSARLHEAYGAAALYLGSTVNASALVETLAELREDVVIVPAGAAEDPAFDAQEDWAAAAAIGILRDPAVGEGAAAFRHWRARIENEGLRALFESAPHAEALRRVGLAEDIPFARGWTHSGRCRMSSNARRPGRCACVRRIDPARPACYLEPAFWSRGSDQSGEVFMDGLMMDFELTLDAVLRRAEQHFFKKEIVTRLPDKSFHRYTYRDMARRAKQLALALKRLGIRPGETVGTLCWNHYQHLEAYFAIPIVGGILHTLNLRLHPDDLTYIANDASDRAIIVDESLLPLLNQFKDRIGAQHFIVIRSGGDLPEGMLDYEELIGAEAPDDFDYAKCALRERQAAATCYTSGTTGKPKGVLYSHRSLVLHSLAAGLPDVLDVREDDCLLPVVPMFHANAWGLPYAAAMAGPKFVFPGPHLDPASLLENFVKEEVTVSAGVPTIWQGLLATLDANPGKYDLSKMRNLIVGGSAVPISLMKNMEERHGLHITQAWGMTELSPLGTISNLSGELKKLPKDKQYEYRAMQGTPAPLVEIRARGDEGFVPWDGSSMGELEVRGPWIASAYFNRPDATDRFTDDGWFKTGDIVTIDETGYIKIQDRSKDLVKSGGEWISSVDLENAIMGHPAVAEAAVIAIPHPKWDERPLAAVVLRDGQTATAADIKAYLADKVAKWWIPDAVEFIDEVPKTSVGKFKKTELREMFKDFQFTE
jgi:fatty-acyl-CoA synthase